MKSIRTLLYNGIPRAPGLLGSERNYVTPLFAMVARSCQCDYVIWYASEYLLTIVS